MLVRRPPNVKYLTNLSNRPLSSRHANSFLTVRRQRWCYAYACGVSFLSELANRDNVNRSEISYFEHESWGRWFLLQTRQSIGYNIIIKVSVVLVSGGISFDEARCILIFARSILCLPPFSIVVTHIPLRRPR